MLLCLSSGLGCGVAKDRVELTGDVALEATDDFGLGLALGRSAFHVGLGRRVPLQSDEDNPVQRSVGLPVPAPVVARSMPSNLARFSITRRSRSNVWP